MSEFLAGIEPKRLENGRQFAVKVASTGRAARGVHLAKPEIMLKHELYILEAFNRAERHKPTEQTSVVKLFGE